MHYSTRQRQSNHPLNMELIRVHLCTNCLAILTNKIIKYKNKIVATIGETQPGFCSSIELSIWIDKADTKSLNEDIQYMYICGLFNKFGFVPQAASDWTTPVVRQQACSYIMQCIGEEDTHRALQSQD